MSLGGSTPAGNTTVTQSSAPFSGQQPYLFGSGGTAPGNTGYSTQNTPLMNLLGGSLANSGGSSPLQDIARAMSEGLPISDASWAQAGLPPGGGATGQQLQSDIFGNPSLSQANPTIGGNAIEGLLPAASNLFQNYTPQYYPGATYAVPTQNQMSGLDMQAALGMYGLPTQGAASNTALSIMDPSFLSSNPGSALYNNAAAGGLALNTGSYYAPIASGQIQNTGGLGPLSQIAGGFLSNGYGIPTLSGIASGQNLNTAGQGTLQNAASGGMANNAGTGFFSTLANGGLQNGAGVDTLQSIANGQPGNLPGVSELQNIANGSNLMASNPYFQQMAQNVTAQVLPAIDAQFASGNRMDSGLATQAAASGLGNAIGGLAYQNYQQGLQQQQQAANALGDLGLSNNAQRAGAASALSGVGFQNLANEMAGAGQLSGIGFQNLANELGAANSLGQFGAQNLGAQLSAGGMLGQLGQSNIGDILSASGQLGTLGQENIGNMLAGAQGLSGVEQANTGTQLAGAAGQSANYSDALKNQIQAMALSPEFQSMAFNNAGSLYNSGAQQQALNQQAINDAVSRWNYYQQLPYNQLNQYAGAIGGNYGGTGTTTQPYFQNQAANGLTGLLGGGMLGSSLFSAFPQTFGSIGLSAGSAGGIGSLLGGLLAFL